MNLTQQTIEARRIAYRPMVNPHEVRFNAWRARCRHWLRLERGRMSALAMHLGVRRQTVWRWFNNQWCKFPGWAAVACNIYYFQHVSPEADGMLKEGQKFGPLEVPKLRSVTPEADKQPSLSPDRGTNSVPYVTRQADKPKPHVLPLP
jgi:hypothetical protein